MARHTRRSVAHRRIGFGLFLPGLLVMCFQGCTVQEGHAHGGRAVRQAPAGADRPVVVMRPQDADHLWVFAESKDQLGSGGDFHIFIDPEHHPGARASFAEFGLGVDGALPIHRHEKTEEIAYFLSGEGIVQTYRDGHLHEIAVRAGYVWYNPPGAWHGVKNTGAEPLKLVFATIPNEKKGLLSFFRKIGAKPGVKPTPLSPEEFGKLAAEHDLILGPPAEVK